MIWQNSESCSSFVAIQVGIQCDFSAHSAYSQENDQESYLVDWSMISRLILYRCAAIEVRLSISNNLKPSLVVASREHLYKVDPISATNPHRALIAAGRIAPGSFRAVGQPPILN
jgi:hypothetical protein